MQTCEACGGSPAVRLGRTDGSPGVCGNEFHDQAEGHSSPRSVAVHSPGPFSLGTDADCAVVVSDVLCRPVAKVYRADGEDKRPGSPYTAKAAAGNVRLLRTAPELRKLAEDLSAEVFSRDEATGREVLERICRFKRRAARLLAYIDGGEMDFIAATND